MFDNHEHSNVCEFYSSITKSEIWRCFERVNAGMRMESEQIHPSTFPSILPSAPPPPVGHQGLKFALLALNLALQASNQPSRLPISPPASNLTFTPQICPPDFNQPFKHVISTPWLKFAL